MKQISRARLPQALDEGPIDVIEKRSICDFEHAAGVMIAGYTIRVRAPI